jgi:peptidoglycan hydrolase CwlO-like protein
MYQRMALIVSLLLLVLIGGCVERQEYQSDSKQRNQADASSVDQQVTELAAKLERLQGEIRALEDTAKNAKTRNDSLVQLYEASEAENAKLKAQLAEAREGIQYLLRKVDETVSFYSWELDKCQSQLSLTENNLAITEQECTILQGENDGLQTENTHLKLWGVKWKHDATERNFLEKLLGADKAPVPEIEEPQLE